MGRIICAWCEREGKTETMIMGEAQSERDSHGVCVDHQEKMLKQIAALQHQWPTANPRRRKRR